MAFSRKVIRIIIGVASTECFRMGELGSDIVVLFSQMTTISLYILPFVVEFDDPEGVIRLRPVVSNNAVLRIDVRLLSDVSDVQGWFWRN